MEEDGNGPAPRGSQSRAAAPAEAAGGNVLPASQLHWQQIPSFNPQETDVQIYSRSSSF